MLGISRYEVLSVLDLKDAFNSLRLLENSKEDTVESHHMLVALHVYIRECL